MNTITTLHDEIEHLHRECMDDLNRQGWACDDMLTELEVMGDELAAHFEAAQLRTGRRLRLARVMLAGAKDETSRRIAHRVVRDWFGQGDLPRRQADELITG